jgi:hypothetical protein
MKTDLGYRVGFTFGYYWSDSFSSEVTFDYMTNPGETSFSDGSTYSSGVSILSLRMWALVDLNLLKREVVLLSVMVKAMAHGILT